MTDFKRVIRFFLGIVGLIAAGVAAGVVVLTRMIVSPPRLPLWGNPADVGLDSELIHFPARDDGLRLSGWFIKSPSAGERRPTVILIHDWGWNRLGVAGVSRGAGALGLSTIELLRLAHALVESGYHVLMFDLRNHGESAAAGPMTFGYRESLDLLGALDYLDGRSDVGSVGLVGFGMGANAALYALTRLKRPQTVSAAVLVQPVDPYDYLLGLTRDVIGPFNQLVVPLTNELVSWTGAPPPAAVNPRFAAAGGPAVPLLFLQESADRWGTIDGVVEISTAAPGPTDTVITTTGDHRYAGFDFLVNRPQTAIDFFDRLLN